MWCIHLPPYYVSIHNQSVTFPVQLVTLIQDYPCLLSVPDKLLQISDHQCLYLKVMFLILSNTC